MDFPLFHHSFPWFQSGALNLDLFNEAVSSGLYMAQTYKEDLFGSVARSWDHFIRSGQVWALSIGFFVGYLFRSLTA
jgi:hypothetical protein